MIRATDIADEARQIGARAPRIANIAAIVGGVGLLVGLVSGFISGWDAFFRSYLLNYCYVLSIALGALFFVMLQHAVRAGWSVSVRRLAEFMTTSLPLLAVLFLPMLIPVLAGMEGVYEWSSSEAVAHDDTHLLEHKQPYLNVPFFIVRCAIYFGVWVLLGRFFFRKSVEQDTTGDVSATHAMQWWSPIGILAYAITVTFFAIDALMSLNPHWFSTIWGVYFFSGSMVAFFATLALVIYILQHAGRLTRAVTVEHYHDIGKLAFGFVVFWAYIKFSQYMLIWYANIPEETVWYHARQMNDWWIGVSLVLLFGHFVAPFLALISRWPKRRTHTLAFASVWLLLMHWIDLYYIVMPPIFPPHGEHGAPLHLSDFALLVGLGGLFVFAIVRPMSRHALVPTRDPRLHESLAFENV